MRSIFAALAFLLLTASAFGQDISWVRDGKATDSATSTTSNDRANCIRAFIGENYFKVLESDTFVVRGEADFGKDYPLALPAARYEMAPGACWTTRVKIDQTPNKPSGTTGFVLDKGKYKFKNFWAIGRCFDANEDSGIFCWNTSVDSEVTFEGGYLDGSFNCDWGPVYNWSGGAKSVRMIGVKASSTRTLLSLASSGGLSQTFYVDNCDFTVNANGSKSIGESSSSNPDTGGVIAAILCRGGQGDIKNSRVKIVGLSAPYETKYGPTRIGGILTDRYYSASQAGKFVVENVTVEIVPGISTVVNDIDVRFGTVGYQSGGSNQDGTYKTFSAVK